MNKNNKGQMPNEKKDLKNRRSLDELKYLATDIRRIHELGEDIWIFYAY
ncbi:MAG: hypothetical protein V2I31_08000 [Mariniphaga sp.]|jgi:hypothetical protein|nr:hypothetical protein [Mariniphaga sp.]